MVLVPMAQATPKAGAKELLQSLQSKFDRRVNILFFARTTEAIVLMNETWRKLNANMRQYVPFRVNMGQHCSLSAVQR